MTGALFASRGFLGCDIMQHSHYLLFLFIVYQKAMREDPRRISWGKIPVFLCLALRRQIAEKNNTNDL